jgi:predicted Zn-dependent protease
MRSLLGGLSPVAVAVVVTIEVLACPRTAAPQPQTQGASRPASRTSTTADIRARVRNTSDGDVALEHRMTLRLESAQRLLFDGRYGDATTAFNAALESGDAHGIDTLTSWAYHGMAVAEALAGHSSRARSLYDDMLRTAPKSPLATADSIEAFVLSHRWNAANPLLDRFAKDHPAALFQQYVHSFRAVEWMLMGRCPDAMAELSRAPDPDRPLPQAVRAQCAANSNTRAEAIALRDSVLTHPRADPLSWPMIVARGIALRIH